MFNLASLSNIREYSNNFYHFATENIAPIRNSLDVLARKLAVEIHTFVGTLDKKLHFKNDSTGETLKRLWSIVYTPDSSEEKSEVQKIDATAQVIKKLAFSLLIAIPVAYAIKETLSVANLDLADASSISHAVSLLTKKILYVGVILYFANLAVSVFTASTPDNIEESRKDVI